MRENIWKKSGLLGLRKLTRKKTNSIFSFLKEILIQIIEIEGMEEIEENGRENFLMKIGILGKFGENNIKKLCKKIY